VIVTLAGLAVVLGPATVLISSLIHSLETVARHVQPGRTDLPPPPELLRQLPVVGDGLVAAWSQAATNLEGFLGRYSRAMLPAGEWLLRAVTRLGGSVVVILAAVCVSGFLLVPGPRMARLCRAFAARLAPGHGAAFVDLAGATIRNVARGVLGIATIQALLMGLGLIVAGVPAAGLLSLISLVLAILQIGLVPVTAPLLIWGWFHFDTVPALILTLYMVPVTLADGPLKAVMMGKGLHTPLLVILAGVIGGTITYGLVGLFLGPILLAVFYDLVTFWMAEGPERGGIE
jgi:predicted PurR-regulated permease PerM